VSPLCCLFQDVIYALLVCFHHLPCHPRCPCSLSCEGFPRVTLLYFYFTLARPEVLSLFLPFGRTGPFQSGFGKFFLRMFFSLVWSFFVPLRWQRLHPGLGDCPFDAAAVALRFLLGYVALSCGFASAELSPFFRLLYVSHSPRRIPSARMSCRRSDSGRGCFHLSCLPWRSLQCNSRVFSFSSRARDTLRSFFL